MRERRAANSVVELKYPPHAAGYVGPTAKPFESRISILAIVGTGTRA
jgi:hypothetical protein